MTRRRGITGAIAAAATAAVVGLYALVGGGVDTAGSPLSYNQATQLKDSGDTLFIQALSWWPSCSNPTSLPSTREASLRNADAAGLDIAGYILLDSHSTGAQAVDRAYDGIPFDLWNRLKFAAVDFEIPTECYNTGTRIERDTICDALDELSRLGMPRVLYTSYGEWGSRLDPPDPLGCPDTYLWLANWDNDPESSNFDRHPFGGWQASDVVIKQYTGNTNKYGVYVDQNSYVRPFPWEPPVWTCGPDGDAWNSEYSLWFFNGSHFYDPKTGKHEFAPEC